MKGQLSAEMLILIVVILAVVAIVASQLLSTAQAGGDQVKSQGDSILGKADAASKAKQGEFCVKAEDCLSGSCYQNSCN
jgi:uncharacterized protein (UPF0333 family)